MSRTNGSPGRKQSRRSPEQPLAAVNRSMRNGILLTRDGLWARSTGERISLHVPDDLRREVWSALAGIGPTPAALARRLSQYGRSEWERRYLSVFPQDEPDADRLQERTDHKWTVIPRLSPPPPPPPPP